VDTSIREVELQRTAPGPRLVRLPPELPFAVSLVNEVGGRRVELDAGTVTVGDETPAPLSLTVAVIEPGSPK
jgi:hypothetical protein